MNLSRTGPNVLRSLLILLCFLPATKGMAGYWEDQFAFPAQFKSVPADATPPLWSKTINVIGILQLRDDLGRQQAEQLDRLSRRMGEEIDVGLYSIDRAGPSWTPEYIVDVCEERGIQLPVFEIPPDAMKEFFRGFQPKPAEIYPQIRLFGGNRRLLGTLRGVQTAERIEQAVEEASKALGPWMETLPAPTDPQLVANGDFEKWGKDEGPKGWNSSKSSAPAPLQAQRRGWNASTAIEIHAATTGEIPMVFQALAPSTSLAGKRLRLSAAIQTNCIAQPVVALAIAHPKEEAAYHFIPNSPFQTSSGAIVPMRIVGALDFRDERPAWNRKTRGVVFPSDTTIPAELLNPTLFIYFNNPKDSGGAAWVDEVRLELLD